MALFTRVTNGFRAVKDRVRDVGWESVLETFWQDLRYASRMLRRAPGFTAVAGATIALGIGGSTAIFTVVDSVLLRPLSFAEPQRLTMIRPTSGSRLSPAYLHDWRLESQSFQDIAGWHDVRANLTGRGALAAAGLLGRTFWELNRVDPGFQTDGVLTMRTTLPESRYDTDERIRAFSSDLLERLEHLPGIRAVGSVNYLPMSRFGAADRFEIEGRPESRLEDQKFSWVSVVGGRYFEAMGIPLLRGRLPGDADTERHNPSSSSTRSWRAATGRARIRSAHVSLGAGVRRGSQVKSSAWSAAYGGAGWPRVPKRRRISGSLRIRADN